MIAVTLTRETYDADRYDDLADSPALLAELRHDNGDITFVLEA